jgi:hypothetical protein
LWVVLGSWKSDGSAPTSEPESTPTSYNTNVGGPMCQCQYSKIRQRQVQIQIGREI